MNKPGEPDGVAAILREISALAARLEALRARYDVLMNAFEFDEARRLQSCIEAAEREHRRLTASLPPPAPAAPPTPYRVAAPRRRR